MDEFKQKLEETLNRLYKKNQISIDAYAELMEFADPNQALQLQQTGVKQSVCKNCGKPFVMHSRASGMCPDRFKHFE